MKFCNRLLAILVWILISPLAMSDDWVPAPGFVSLFNGKDFSGWHYKGDADLGGKVSAIDDRYTAADGVLTVHPQDAAKGPRIRQIYTLKEFSDDFILRLEFRASVGADSGIFLRVPQLQCRDYLVAGPYKELKSYRPQGWNTIEVTVKGGVAHCTCNGEVLEMALVLPKTGPIGLEADSGTMEYRHMEIRLLP